VTHRCDGPYLRADRMLLASLSQNQEALDLVIGELGDCIYCWRGLALHLVYTLANDRALYARSLSKATEAAARGVARYLMPGAIPDPELHYEHSGVANPSPGEDAANNQHASYLRRIFRRWWTRKRSP
jgi:hypothetical protein